jgi:signal transduction histidine kinase
VGVADALIAEDAERLREITLPFAVNAQEEAIEFINLQGVSVLSLRHRPDDRNEEYVSTRGDASFGAWDVVQKVAQGIVDDDGDKYSTIIAAPWGNYFYVAGPVIASDGRRVGIVLVGKTLQTLANEFREQTLAQTTFYNLQGVPLTSTLLADKETLPLLDTQYATDVLNNRASSSLMRDLSIASINYTEIVGTWSVRGSTQVGMIGTSLPHTFFVRPSEITRIQIFVLVAVGLILVISIGLYLSRRITQPLLQVVNASAQVAQGNLDVSVEPVGNDEVAVLAHAFNHMMVGLRDATERKLREIQLMKALEHERELRELKSRFVSMVSHEFRTPLATILSSTEYIKTYGHEAPYPKRQKHFTRIQDSVSNMTRLLEDVLIIGRDESGRLEFNPTLIDIEQFCKELTEEMQTTAGERHTIMLDHQGKDTQLLLDEKLLRVALTNLLSNAIKYSLNGGDVYFDLICEPDTVFLRVRDTGIGIPEKDQQRLFETFHRASNVSNISGTGLGLYITKMVVELHDGTINFESQLDSGTTFTITIPARRGTEKTA